MTEDDQREIEQEFAASWDMMEQFYLRPILARQEVGWDWEWLQSMLELVIELRKRGYDRQLRAGQQLDALVLSRSREHGLRPNQPWFRIETSQNDGTYVWYSEPPDVWMQFQIERVEITPEVEDLLKRLLAHPID